MGRPGDITSSARPENSAVSGSSSHSTTSLPSSSLRSRTRSDNPISRSNTNQLEPGRSVSPTSSSRQSSSSSRSSSPPSASASTSTSKLAAESPSTKSQTSRTTTTMAMKTLKRQHFDSDIHSRNQGHDHTETLINCVEEEEEVKEETNQRKGRAETETEKEPTEVKPETLPPPTIAPQSAPPPLHPRNFEHVRFGKYLLESWFHSPYPISVDLDNTPSMSNGACNTATTSTSFSIHSSINGARKETYQKETNTNPAQYNVLVPSTSDALPLFLPPDSASRPLPTRTARSERTSGLERASRSVCSTRSERATRVSARVSATESKVASVAIGGAIDRRRSKRQESRSCRIDGDGDGDGDVDGDRDGRDSGDQDANRGQDRSSRNAARYSLENEFGRTRHERVNAEANTNANEDETERHQETENGKLEGGVGDLTIITHEAKQEEKDLDDRVNVARSGAEMDVDMDVGDGRPRGHQDRWHKQEEQEADREKEYSQPSRIPTASLLLKRPSTAAAAPQDISGSVTERVLPIGTDNGTDNGNRNKRPRLYKRARSPQPPHPQRNIIAPLMNHHSPPSPAPPGESVQDEHSQNLHLSRTRGIPPLSNTSLQDPLNPSQALSQPLKKQVNRSAGKPTQEMLMRGDLALDDEQQVKTTDGDGNGEMDVGIEVKDEINVDVDVDVDVRESMDLLESIIGTEMEIGTEIGGRGKCHPKAQDTLPLPIASYIPSKITTTSSIQDLDTGLQSSNLDSEVRPRAIYAIGIAEGGLHPDESEPGSLITDTETDLPRTVAKDGNGLRTSSSPADTRNHPRTGTAHTRTQLDQAAISTNNIPEQTIKADPFNAKSVSTSNASANAPGEPNAISNAQPESEIMAKTNSAIDSSNYHGKTLYVCDKCFKYMKTLGDLKAHESECTINIPPGRLVYRNDPFRIYEIDGAEQKLYCQCLSLFGKLFIDHKTIFFDVDNFLFYVVTEATSNRDHTIGYFSKEKISYDDYNLACIVTFPPFQGGGFGRLMMEFSYYLTRSPSGGSPGTPERPLSLLGSAAYRSYWICTLLRTLLLLFVEDENAPEDWKRVWEKKMALAKVMPDKATPVIWHDFASPDDSQPISINTNITIDLAVLSYRSHLLKEDVLYALNELGFLDNHLALPQSQPSLCLPSKPDTSAITINMDTILKACEKFKVRVKGILDESKIVIGDAEGHQGGGGSFSSM